MKRRTFIYGIAGIAAISVPTVYFFVGRNFAYDSLIAEPGNLSQIWDAGTITSIGDQYILQVPSESTENKLSRLLVKSAPRGTENVPVALAEKVNSDFEEGKTVIVDGWVLSVTEARQCALCSIIKKQ